jgi:hypothetical protein
VSNWVGLLEWCTIGAVDGPHGHDASSTECSSSTLTANDTTTFSSLSLLLCASSTLTANDNTTQHSPSTLSLRRYSTPLHSGHVLLHTHTLIPHTTTTQTTTTTHSYSVPIARSASLYRWQDPQVSSPSSLHFLFDLIRYVVKLEGCVLVSVYSFSIPAPDLFSPSLPSL